MIRNAQSSILLVFFKALKVLSIVFVESDNSHGVLGQTFGEKVFNVVSVRSLMVLASLSIGQRTMLRASLRILTSRTSKQLSMMTIKSSKTSNLRSISATVKAPSTMIQTERRGASSKSSKSSSKCRKSGKRSKSNLLTWREKELVKMQINFLSSKQKE